jgi:hypothetical protein
MNYPYPPFTDEMVACDAKLLDDHSINGHYLPGYAMDNTGRLWTCRRTHGCRWDVLKNRYRPSKHNKYDYVILRDESGKYCHVPVREIQRATHPEHE